MASVSITRGIVGGLMMGAVGLATVALSTSLQGGRRNVAVECESGVLDAGEGGLNVLVYRLCAGRLTVGFKDSDSIEEIHCLPNGGIELWLSADNGRCGGQPSSDDQVYELNEPLKGVGRATAAPVRQLLTCRGGVMNQATIVVPEARAALLETRRGDTEYEAVTRQFISGCVAQSA
ncbi:hypothetical protein BH11PSE3_BH11PSE3_41440 [soil metagenome]